MRFRQKPADETPAAPEVEPAADVAPVRKGYTPPKGRPTARRRDSEARNVRPLVVNDRREAKARARTARNEAWVKQQQAMRTGDERYLPVRDKGAARRYTRDFVDSLWLPSQIFLPGAVIIMLGMILVGQYFPGQEATIVLAMYVLLALSILVSLAAVWVLKRRLAKQFAESEIPRWTGAYAFTRAMYPRFLRQPKPQVRVGGSPVNPGAARGTR